MLTLGSGLIRREFVSVLGSKAARLASSLAPHRTTMLQTQRNSPRGKPHVGIVGAGIAGLRCADVLVQHGFKVTVLEGRNRVGGRLHQERMPNGILVDMGPNWIHGTKENPIYDIVKETQTLATDPDMDENGAELGGGVFDENGALLPPADGIALFTVMWTIIEEAFAYSREHCAEIDTKDSLRDFFIARLHEAIPDPTPDCETRRSRTLQAADFWGAFVGSPIERQSLKYFWLEECIEGENLFCAETYKKVLDKIAKPVLQQGAIQLGKVVMQIAGKPGASIEEQVTVVTSSGESFKFDEVVVTSPLGWLKRNLQAFEPPLPARLCKAIQSVGYGSLEKVHISFSEAFWQSPDDSGRAVRGFCQWLAPGLYAHASNQSRWPQEAVDLSSLPAEVAHPTLLFYTFGDQSKHLVNALAEFNQSDDEGRNKLILDYFHPFYSRLPHYDETLAACQPTGCLASSWLLDDLAGNGSYSNFQVGLEAGDEDIVAMREGVPSRGLWLAGEHTAPFVSLGTVTGAYVSGETVANRIRESFERRQAR